MYVCVRVRKRERDMKIGERGKEGQRMKLRE